MEIHQEDELGPAELPSYVPELIAGVTFNLYFPLRGETIVLILIVS